MVKSMARFRMGSHCLGVETERWEGKDWKDRKCKRCAARGVASPDVDDERHVLFHYAHLTELSESDAGRRLVTAEPVPHQESVEIVLFLDVQDLANKYIHRIMRGN